MLLLEAPAGEAPQRWQTVSGAVGPDEGEARAALRALADQTALEPLRLYATSWLREESGAEGAGRVGVFVAWVAPGDDVATGPEHADFVWLPIFEALQQISAPADRDSLESVRERFVRRSPDEALRVL